MLTKKAYRSRTQFYKKNTKMAFLLSVRLDKMKVTGKIPCAYLYNYARTDRLFPLKDYQILLKFIFII